MAWSRGFFRIWIVLSITWMVGTTLAMWQPMFGGGSPSFEHWYRFDWTDGAVQLGPLDKEWQDYVAKGQPLPPGDAWTTLRSTDFAYHLKHAAGIEPADLQRAVAVVQADLNDLQRSQDQSRHSSIPYFIGIIIGPPMLVLLLGALVGWVAVGFRRRY